MTEAEAKDLIAIERKRQVDGEGYDPAHDDAHRDGEILAAADCYVANVRMTCGYRADGVPVGWPWEPGYWKPKDAVRDYVRAGALMVAERERLERAGRSADHIEHKLASVVSSLTEIR